MHNVTKLPIWITEFAYWSFPSKKGDDVPKEDALDYMRECIV